MLPSPSRHGSYPGHPHQPARRRRATSAGARCCAASTPSTTWPAVSAAVVCDLCIAARPARGLDPRVRRRRPRAAPPAPRGPLVHRSPALRPPRARARGARGGRARRAAPRRPRRRDAEPLPPSRATSARCRPTPSSRCSARWTSSTRPTTRARSAGVARSLGAPGVCVRPRVDRPAVVSITVMWELSWYRFEVDLSDEAGGVRRDAQGDELSRADPGGAGRQRRGRRARCTASRRSTHDRVLSPARRARIGLVIYCVVPEPLADELYPKLAGYYEDDPNVTVIVDRRKKERRLPGLHRRRPARGPRPAAHAHHRRLPAVRQLSNRRPTSGRCFGSPAGSRRPTSPW